MDTSKFRAIGHSVLRKEDFRLLSGKGHFADDYSMPGQAWIVMVRSPHPHARIVRIESAQARAMPGVLAVYTGADCLADGLRPFAHNAVPSTKYDMKLTAPGGGPVFVGRHMLLAVDKARYVGEAVAMVVAESREQAEDAADAVQVEYEPLRFRRAHRRCGVARGTRGVGRNAATMCSSTHSSATGKKPIAPLRPPIM